jgi:hypothetical protein
MSFETVVSFIAWASLSFFMVFLSSSTKYNIINRLFQVGFEHFQQFAGNKNGDIVG